MAMSDAQPESDASAIAAAQTDLVSLRYPKTFMELAAASELARFMGYRRLIGVEAEESISRASENMGGRHKSADWELPAAGFAARAAVQRN